MIDEHDLVAFRREVLEGIDRIAGKGLTRDLFVCEEEEVVDSRGGVGMDGAAGMVGLGSSPSRPTSRAAWKSASSQKSS